jgi:hypothetical protein
VMRFLESVVFRIQSDPAHSGDSVTTKIAYTTEIGQLILGLAAHLMSCLHLRSPRLMAASIADLKAKLPRSLAPHDPFEGSQKFRLAELELLGPNRAVDLEFEHVAA